MTAPPEVLILGAGPAGVAAAHALTKGAKARVRVLERAPRAGGNSTSFQIEGIWCDYGSHRFYPGADPKVIADVVAHAVRSHRPRTRYAAGKYAKLTIWVRKWLGDRAFDRLIKSQM